MGAEYYFVCNDHEKKIFICRHSPTEDNLNIKNIGTFLKKHHYCSIGCMSSDVLFNTEDSFGVIYDEIE